MTDRSPPETMSFCRCCDDLGVPIIQPLDDMEALLGWVPGTDQACVCHTPLMGPISAPSGPQTLLCHDLSGGYLEDRYPQGVESPDKVCYRFYHWHLVDTFVYFSHHFVTIPPPGWVAAAHRHGTRVLGTLITEWEDGAGLMRAVLKSEDSVSRVVGQLTAIAHYYNFDGWLVNIENQIQSCDIAMLIRFVSALTEETHNALPHGQVIWYDSVTNKGELDWQNALNDLNSQYFDACDGIFLNYTWTEADLASSRERAIRSGRPWDVYVGVDVFGRNCFGGGGFNTAEAVGAARAQHLSVALFAVGWTLQCLPAETFEANENKFWKLLSGLLATRRLCRLPLWSDFSQGFGDAVYSQGKKITDVPWYNLAVQSSQPTVIWGSKEDNSSDSKYGVIALGLKDAFEGGSSLLLEACLPSSAEVSLFDLFQTRVPVSESLVVLYTWKPQGEMVDFFIDVKMENKNSVRTLRLCSENESAVKSRDEESGCVRLGPISEGDLEGILQDRGMLDGNQYGWRTRCFLVNCGQDGEVLHGVGAGILLRQARSRLVSVLLGKLQVIPLSMCRQPSPEVTNLTFHPPSRYPAKGAPSQGPLSERPLSEDPEAGRECHSRAWLTWDITRSDLVDYYSVYRRDFGSFETGTEDADTGDWVLLGHSVSRVFCLPAGVSAARPSPATTAPPSPGTTAPPGPSPATTAPPGPSPATTAPPGPSPATTARPSPATIPASVLVQPVSRSGFRPRLSVCPVLQLSEPRS